MQFKYIVNKQSLMCYYILQIVCVCFFFFFFLANICRSQLLLRSNIPADKILIGIPYLERKKDRGTFLIWFPLTVMHERVTYVSDVDPTLLYTPPKNLFKCVGLYVLLVLYKLITRKSSEM